MGGEQEAGAPNKTGLNLPAFLPLPRRCPHLLPGKQQGMMMRVQGWRQETRVLVLALALTPCAPLTLGSFLIYTMCGGGNGGAKSSGIFS